LVLAEVELESEDQTVERPPWIGQDVTDDPRYFNVNLVRHPYRVGREGHDNSR
jgi:CYTH domain-containing protein